MGKIYRDGIIYAGGGNIKECTFAQYNTWKANGQLVKGVTYDITNAPNLNATAKQISYDGTTTTIHDVIESIMPDFDIGGATKAVNATYQIPANILSHSIINIGLRRYAYCGSVSIITTLVSDGAYANGLIVYSAENKFAEFSISSSGLITITKITNWDSVYIDLVGIF